MFDQQNYINSYIKKNYKTIKIRIRNDDTKVINKLRSVGNVNKYILNLIRNDIKNYHYINSDVIIDFKLSKTMEDLVYKAEEADLEDDYGLYMNLCDAIDSQAKKEVTNHQITDTEWRKLVRRYVI